MSQIKLPRKSTAIDMTAMCDVAFLLLTFFMLTTKFKPQELAKINVPVSTAQNPVPEANVLTIQVNEKGKVFLGVNDQHTREAWLDKIAVHYKLPAFDESQLDNFKLMDAFGVPIEQLPRLLNMEQGERAKHAQPGIRLDSLDNQLGMLVKLAKEANEELLIALKCDGATDYEKVDKVIQTLQAQKVYKFNLITSAKPLGEGKE
jgi:biopolymer transport protein ExbD